MNAMTAVSGKVFKKARKRRAPFPDLLDDDPYRAVRGMSLTPGEVTPFGQRVAFSDPVAFSDQNGFLHSLQDLFVDEVSRVDSDRPDPHAIDAGANIRLSVLCCKQRFADAPIIVSDKGVRYVTNGAHGAGLPIVETVPHGVELRLNGSCFRPADRPMSECG